MLKHGSDPSTKICLTEGLFMGFTALLLAKHFMPVAEWLPACS